MVGVSLGNVEGWKPKCPGCASKGRDCDATVRVTLREEVYEDGRCCSDPEHHDYDYYLVFWCAYCGYIFYTSPHPDEHSDRSRGMMVQ